MTTCTNWHPRDIRVSLPYHVAPYVLITTDLGFTTGRRLLRITPSSSRSEFARAVGLSVIAVLPALARAHRTRHQPRWLREQVAQVASA